ncbi:MmcQ/YjbR family DNA-binding protein [Cereibacter sphaeroides]|uniref:MmcQ/YjbR family DNA-binding protein n=1 Tax=Cereibacter sphaeroides TaxID=1063 RepID=UPI001F245406|nr:MmcQ/YjbR family DNA-binding protein [Cereibacter sphaeroides]MCE6953175.1 MmcQ/YjbR family DNA-binding protein [Cereibacter sphaeroides]
MDRAATNRICAALPGATLDHPWDERHDAWKIGGRIFALIGAQDHGVTVKCPDPETAALLVETGRAERAPYMHRSWVLLPFGPTADMDEVRHRIEVSFRLIRDALPRKVRAALPGDVDGKGREAP